MEEACFVLNSSKNNFSDGQPEDKKKGCVYNRHLLIRLSFLYLVQSLLWDLLSDRSVVLL